VSLNAQFKKLDTLKQFKYVVLPTVYYTPETNWAFGLSAIKLFDKDENDSITYSSHMNAVVVYTLEKQFKLESNLMYYTKENKWNWVVNFELLQYPINFYGIGNTSLDDVKEKFTSRRFTLNNKLYRKVNKQLFLGLQNQNKVLWDIQFPDNGLFDEHIKKGRYSGRTHGLGLMVRYDNRDNNLCPQKGHYLNLEYSFYTSQLLNNVEDKSHALWESFHNILLDFRTYFKLPKGIVSAWQLYGDINFGQVPFYKMASIGSSKRMRGYYGGILIDKHLLMLQTDLRFPLYKKLGGVLFGGLANVTSDLMFQDQTIQPNYGFGMRYMLDPVKKFNLRFDWGFGPGINGFYITASEAF
jgi:outer membrane protein assembly factor BamA